MTQDLADQHADYVEPMVRRTPPDDCHVVEGSTPVVAFGDPTRAKVATLGINPSRREFVDGNDQWLRGDCRRLATLESLGAPDLGKLTETQVARVIGDCATYFDRNPYRRWFRPLDRVLRAAADVSYYDGTACHLDLVQWATDPVWSSLDDGVRQALVDDGVPHLRAQLRSEQISVVVLNGRQVLDQVDAVGLAELDHVGELPLGTGRCSLYSGAGSGIRWFGWSTNLQGSWGVTHEFQARLADWLGEAIRR